MKAAVIVLNYKGAQNTIDCIISLKESISITNHNVQIIVVENGSNDGSKEKLQKLKGIKLLVNNKNLGYSGGNNVGIKYALSAGFGYVIVINNDTIVEKNFINALLADTADAQIITPKIYFAKGYEFHEKRYNDKEKGKIIWYAGGKIDWDNIIGVHIGVDEVDSGQFNNKASIDFATGACMCISASVFNKIDFLEEKYFLYLEDMDFSVRAKKAGFKIIFEPKAIIWHKNAASSGGSGSYVQDYYITRNRLLFSFKFAKLRTKIAVLKQITSQANNPIKRRALIDFLTFNFGENKRFK
ncbi:MAG: glycosyltransferase family 2 protein [Patescibacteria group bacterium]